MTSYLQGLSLTTGHLWDNEQRFMIMSMVKTQPFLDRRHICYIRGIVTQHVTIFTFED